jgi:hypothetical protein
MVSARDSCRWPLSGAGPPPCPGVNGIDGDSPGSTATARDGSWQNDETAVHLGERPVVADRREPALRKDDRNTFWSAEVPSYGVKVPHAGATIKVLTQTGTSMRILVSR